MRFKRNLVEAGLIGASILCSSIACGQIPSNKPLRIVTGGTGGATDFAARLIGQGVTANTGQSVIVDNRASGVVVSETVAKSPPDGYTLLLYGSPMWLLPSMRERVSWDPMRDFSPITLAVSSPNVLVVHPSLPVKSVKDLIVLARARPGELNYASGGSGATPHLAAEFFKALAKVQVVRVNYRGAGPAMNDVIAGQVQIMFANAAAAMPQVKAGRLRALGVTSARPSSLFPGLATVAETGLPGYKVETIYGVFAPTKTPEATTDRLHQDIVRVLTTPETREKFLNVGVEVVASTQAQLASAVASEMAILGKVIKDGGIRDE